MVTTVLASIAVLALTILLVLFPGLVMDYYYGGNQVTPVIPEVIETEIEDGYSQDDLEWSEFWLDAVEEYEDEFTALFNSYEIKRAKNGAIMIRRGNSDSFRFAKKR